MSHIESSIIQYRTSKKNYLTTTRFNNATWNENRQFLNDNSHIGCIYPVPEPNSQDIPVDTNLFVLEMNNEENRIMGIGLVKNKPLFNKYSVYTNPKYNQFAYVGKYRIDRNSMDEMEERIMKVFDILCFKSKRHMKRLLGLKSFPMEMLYNCSSVLDLVDFITNMFKIRLR